MSTPEQLTLFEGAAPGPDPHPASRWRDPLDRQIAERRAEERHQQRMLYRLCGIDDATLDWFLDL